MHRSSIIPHICTIYEVGTHDGLAHIVMEYVEGQTLNDLIPPDGLPVKTVLRYGIHIADALTHAHQNGVIHRDLKGANVVVTKEGRAKVLDFGLARRLSAERLKDLSESQAAVTAEGLVTGTLSCMAPELLLGEQADARSDIWSLGVLLYEMSSGERPFAGATGFALSAAILHEPPAPLPNRIPAPLQRIIRRCLEKHPGERYQHAAEVRSALETVQAQGTSASGPSFPSRRMVAAALLGLLLVAAGAAVAWRLLRAPESPVALGASGRPAIAIMSFDNLAGGEDTAWLSKGLPSMLLTGLAQTRGLDIVSGQRLHEVIKQMGGKSLETLERNEIAEVARRAGAGAVVVGSISKAGSEIRIDAQLEDLASGRVLAAESVHGTDLFVLVDQLAARIRDGIGFRDATDIRSVADVSTASLEAFQSYSRGVDAFINSRLEDAQSFLERAVAIDPTFAGANLYLADIAYFRGLLGLQREYLRKVAEHADRLNERQRLILDAESARAAGNSASAARAFDQLIEKFPDSDEAYGGASQLYAPVTGIIYDPEKSLMIAAAGAAALPKSTPMRNLYAYALLGAGRYAEALREFETNVRVAPREPNPHDSLGEAYLVMGAPDRAVESYSRALTVDPKFYGAHIGRAWSLAALGRYDEALVEEMPSQSVKALILSRLGRYREADEAIEAGRRQADKNENGPEHGSFFLVSSVLAIERREYARALQQSGSAERVFARLPEENRRVYLVLFQLLSGLAQVGAGRMDEARSHLASQGRLVNSAVEPENWWHKALQGEIALAGGDLQNAAAAFSAGQPSRKMWYSTFNMNMSQPFLANNLVSRDGLARVAKARGDLTGAIQIYRHLLTYGPEQKWVSMFEPRYVLEIARLLDRSGDTQGALKEYERFLDFWTRADAGLPELAEARRAAARLRR